MGATFLIISGGVILLIALAAFTILLLQQDALQQKGTAIEEEKEATPLKKVAFNFSESQETSSLKAADQNIKRVPEAV